MQQRVPPATRAAASRGSKCLVHVASDRTRSHLVQFRVGWKIGERPRWKSEVLRSNPGLGSSFFLPFVSTSAAAWRQAFLGGEMDAQRPAHHEMESPVAWAAPAAPVAPLCLRLGAFLRHPTVFLVLRVASGSVGSASRSTSFSFLAETSVATCIVPCHPTGNKGGRCNRTLPTMPEV